MSRRAAALACTLLATACAKPDFYSGPKSDHFGGHRFFNPDGEQGSGGAQRESFWQYLQRGLRGGHHSWPRSVPITPSRPPARVEGQAMLVTWIGHSTVLVQTQGLNILTDPVWAERASPVEWIGPKRVREPGVSFADLPRIDLVLISHDHYDHLDERTLRKLWKRDRPLIVTGLGNEARLAGWGIDAVARDWHGVVPIRPGISVILERAHHWSARTTDDKDLTLWTGFTVTLPGGDLYYAGDTGPGTMRWAPEARHGRPIRLALLPIGPIHEDGVPSGNHIGPAEAVTAFRQLGAANALGVHWGTFELTGERIDQPRDGLRLALAAARIAPDRFRTLEAGQQWPIPVSAPSSSSPAPR